MKSLFHHPCNCEWSLNEAVAEEGLSVVVIPNVKSTEEKLVKYGRKSKEKSLAEFFQKSMTMSKIWGLYCVMRDM